MEGHSAARPRALSADVEPYRPSEAVLRTCLQQQVQQQALYEPAYSPYGVHPGCFPPTPHGSSYMPPTPGTPYSKVPPAEHGSFASGYDPDYEDAVLRQVEYYFSVENLQHDGRLCDRLKNGGLVPLDLVCAFPRLKKLCPHKELVAFVIPRSSLIFLSPDGKRIGRREPFMGGAAPPTAPHKPAPPQLSRSHSGGSSKDAQYRTVEITHLPSEATKQSVQAMVIPFGAVTSVEVRADEGADAGEQGGKLKRATVQFTDIEHALECVDKLASAGGSWRSGFRVSFSHGLTTQQVVRQLSKHQQGGAKAAAKGRTSVMSPQQNGHAQGKGGGAQQFQHQGPDEGGDREGGGGGGTGGLPAEGTFTGVISNLQPDGHGHVRRDGRRRGSTPFKIPPEVHLSVGDHVSYTVVHLDGKAVVTVVKKAEGSANGGRQPTLNGSHAQSVQGGHSTSGITEHKGLGTPHTPHKQHYKVSKGPDGTIGFTRPRTRPAATPGDDHADVAPPSTAAVGGQEHDKT